MASFPRGIDVSNNQGAIDWAAVASSGVEFAIAKASEGTYFRDGWFSENWSACKLYGVARGAYHYAVPSNSSAEAEADYFLDAIEKLYGPLEVGDVLAVDLEDPQASGDLSDWCLAWLQRVEALVGYKPMVYTSPSYATAHCLYNRSELAAYGLWLASWGVPTPPPAPPPWRLVAVHQIGIGPPGSVPGVATSIDLDRFNGSSVEQFKAYGMPAGAAPPEPVPPEPTPPAELPVYNPNEPPHIQEHDYDCSQDSIEWCLYAYGRTPDEGWMLQSMIDAGVLTPAYGCMDASGAGLAGWLNTEYGEFGYVASNADPVSFDDVAAEAATLKHPLAIGGRGWYHWSGVSGYDPIADALILKNPAPNWMGVGQSMSRETFAELGSFSMVRLTHPAAEAEPPPDPDPGPPADGGDPGVGSGLLAMMAEDGTQPAMASSFLPLGRSPATVEWGLGLNGTMYLWHLPTGSSWRYKPS